MSTSSRSGVGSWSPAPPPRPRRLVVVAPHPDDETLGAAGIMCWAGQMGAEINLIAVTDGEASHRDSTRVSPTELRIIRAGERDRAVHALDLAVDVVRLGLPDGDVSSHRHRLCESLTALLTAECTVLAPWSKDGHDDHHATAVAAAEAAASTGSTFLEYLVWGKVGRSWTSERHSTLVLTADARAAKEAAVRHFASQLDAIGPDPEDGPVVRPDELELMLDGTEVVIW